MVRCAGRYARRAARDLGLNAGATRLPFAAVLLAALLALACPPAGPATHVQAPGTQLITVEAARTGTTYATLRTWERRDGCWRPAAGPYSARVGWAGVRRDRHEGDGTTPIGTFPIGRTM